MLTKNFNLKNSNSFSISVLAEKFYEFSTKDELVEIIKLLKDDKYFILGDGNNVLFTNDIKNIIHSKINFIKEISQKNNEVIIQVGSGFIWDDFVSYCVEKNYYGCENLTAIPSSVGATVVQNIGAYGVEAKDIIDSVEVFDTFYNKFLSIKNRDCKFTYRDSIFKQTDRYIVISVFYKVSTIKKINIDYSDLKLKLSNCGKEVNSKLISETVRQIRDSKLPNVNKIGNAGSFFKNPIISFEQFSELQKICPNLKGYKSKDGYKISAAFLIEKAGLKGYKKGDAGVYDKHSLILVNHNNATGKEILEISKTVINKVKKEFDIILSPEVNIL